MKELVRTIVGLACLSALGAAYVDIASMPHPKVKAPDGRYAVPLLGNTVVKDTQDFTVLISNERMGELSRGTGILLDATTVLTCAHVVPEDGSTKDMWIYPYPGAQVLHATLEAIDSTNDLALLKLPTPALGHKVPVFAPKVVIGEPVVVVGNIKGYMMWFVSYGIISGEQQRWVLTDALIKGGNSGGPWVNAKGEIIALTDVGWSDGKGRDLGISGGVPVQDLQKFLLKAKHKDKGLTLRQVQP